MNEQRLASIFAMCVVACSGSDPTVDGGADATTDVIASDVTTRDVTPDVVADAASDSCVGSQTDTKNCGACGVVCASSLVCTQGKCSCPAQDGGALTLCTPDAGASYCANTNDDSNHCGGCNVACGQTEVCSNGTCATPTPKLVFVSSAQYGADLAGLTGADAKCQALATAASLSGTYKAWLSDDNTNAATRLAHATVAYVLVDGSTVVANNWTGLTSGTLLHAIDHTEDGGAPALTPYCGGTHTTVYSNTLFNGTQDAVGFNCTNWTGAGTKVNLGYADATDLHWAGGCSANAAAFCDGTNASALYCIEQ